MIYRELRNFITDNDGIGVIEVVLILVVLIGLVIIFKEQIGKLLNNIFKEINSQSKDCLLYTSKSYASCRFRRLRRN